MTYDVWRQPINDNPVVRRYHSNFELKKERKKERKKTYPLGVEEVGSERVRCKLELLLYTVTVGNLVAFESLCEVCEVRVLRIYTRDCILL